MNMKTTFVILAILVTIHVAMATRPIWLHKNGVHRLLATGAILGAGYSLLGAGALYAKTGGHILPKIYIPLPTVVHHHQPVIHEIVEPALPEIHG